MDSSENEDIDSEHEFFQLLKKSAEKYDEITAAMKKSKLKVKSLFQLSLENALKPFTYRSVMGLRKAFIESEIQFEFRSPNETVQGILDGVSKSSALHKASAHGFLELVRCLIKIGTKIDSKQLNGDIITPLVIASKNGHVEIVSELLKFGAEIDLDIEAGKPLTSLQTAVKNGHESVVKVLLENGAKVDNIGEEVENEKTPLCLAAELGSLPIVKLLLSHGAYVNSPFPIDKLKENHEFPEKLGYNEACEELEEKDPDEYLSMKMPLHAACQEGHLEIVRELLKHGAFLDAEYQDLDSDDEYGHTPIGLAIKFGHERIVNELLKHKPNLVETREYGIRSAILVAMDNDDLKMVKKLIAYGADISGQSIDFLESPLYVAFSNRNYEMMSLLLAKGANIDEKGFYPTTLFQDIAMGKDFTEEDVKMFYYLLLKGANINTQDDFGKTALHHTAEQRYLPNVVKLLDHGADPYVQDNKKNTALHLAVMEYQGKHGMYVIDELLDDIKGMKNVSLINEDGETALEIALRKCTEGSNKAKRKYYLTVAQKIAKVACPKPKISDPIYPLKFLF